MMRRPWAALALGIAAALACFGAGIAVTLFVQGAPPGGAPHPSPSGFTLPTPPDTGPPEDAAAARPKAPTILVDPSSIQLLPDASLRFNPPPGFDASAP